VVDGQPAIGRVTEGVAMEGGTERANHGADEGQGATATP